MGKESGEMFRCDRAPGCHADGRPHFAFLNATDKERKDWLEVEWIDTMGAPIRYLLCPECKGRYEILLQSQRQTTQDFMYDHILDPAGE